MSSLPPEERESIIREILDGLSVQVSVETPPYGISPPRLRVTIQHNDTLLSSDYVSLSELQPD